MQSRKLKHLVKIFFILFIFSACTSDYIVPEPPPPPVPVEPINPNDSIPNDTIPVHQISYSGVIQPIFTAKCVSCHGVGQTAPVLVAGKSYKALMNSPGMIDTINPGNSILYKEMAPGGGMSSTCKKADADSVYKWIDQGAKNN
jgi:hypothetical protein